MKKDNKKKNPIAAIIVAIVIILNLITKSDDAAEAVVGLLGIAVIAVPIVLIIWAINKKTKKSDTKASASSKPAASYHSHDRLSQNNLSAEHLDGLEHYKRQLDDFLAAGIIDRAEYRLLLNKYRKNLQ